MSVGLGFLIGFGAATLPLRYDSVQLSDQHVAAWIAWVGVGFVAAGLAWFTPMYLKDRFFMLREPHDEPGLVITAALGIGALVPGLVATSLVSAGNPLRWRPLWFLGLILVVMPVILWRQYRATRRRRAIHE